MKGVFLRKFRLLPWPLLFILLFLIVAIAVSSYFFYQKQKKDVFHEQITQLQTIADLKTVEINSWRQQMLNDGDLIFYNRIITDQLLSFLHRPTTSGKNKISEWLGIRRSHLRYLDIILSDAAGNVRLSARGGESRIGSEELKLMDEARRKRKVVLSDLHRSENMPQIHLETVVPLVAGKLEEPASVGGFLLLRSDPKLYLFPMIQSWPTPSSTAETLLVQRERHDVVFLNELRHRRNTALNLRLPLTSRDLPAAMAVLGKTGAFSGRDYRGVPVWSVLKPVPDSPWFIVAKVDREEIERPIRRSALAIFLVAFSLILAAALMILFLWQRQNTRFRLRQLEAENQKQALVQHFDYLTRYANDIIMLTDEQWNILEANERAMVTYGYGREALLKMNLRDLLVAEEREKLAAQMRQAEEWQGLLFETVQQKKDGSVFPVEISARAIAVTGKKYFQSIVRDISERKRAEAALRESEERFRSLYENSTIGMYRTTPEGRILMANPSLVRMLGYEDFNDLAQRDLGKNGFDDGFTRIDFLSQIEKNGQIIGQESAWKRRDGSTVFIRESSKAIRDASGKTIFFEGTVEDVSARHLAEEEIGKLNAELEQRVQQRTAQLETANKELEAFSYSVSHDLRAPLRAIDGFSRIVLEEYAPKLDDEGRRLLEVIIGNTRKMGQLIDDLLAFSRLSRQQMAFALVNLAALADDAFSELKSAEKGRRIEFKINALPAAHGDRSMLRHVLINLLSNALKFTRPRAIARIEIGDRAAIGETIYYVKDNGVGFDMEYAHKLFGVFQRLHGSDEFEGTGVGLAIAQRIVLRHGGRIWAESGKGGGATFYFSLPTETACETTTSIKKPAVEKAED